VTVLADRYPRSVTLADGEVTLEHMGPADEADVLAFARALPRHDLLFLRRDITRAPVLAAWLRQIEDGTIDSLVARRDGRLVGCTAVVTDPLSWSPHVGELRVLLAPDDRARGLGRMLVQECFLIALARELRRLTVQMTADQEAARTVFEDLGFRGEALLRDQVRDDEGRHHDLLVLAHDVERFQAQLEAYGIADALG
jgi:L-amino acid N-acyltransferase YncA